MSNHSVFDSQLDARASNETVPLSVFSIQCRSLDIISHWQRCGLIADFLSKFETIGSQQPLDLGNALSTVINELLENASKFSSNKMTPLTLTMKSYEDNISIDVSNTAEVSDIKQLDDTINELDSHADTIDDFFLEQLEIDDSHVLEKQSKLGLLTIKRDFLGDISYKTVKKNQDENEVVVTIKVTLPKKGVNNDN